MNNFRLYDAIADNPNIVQPMGNYVIVDIFKAEDQTKGGVALPDQVKDQDRRMLAWVLSVGKGRKGLAGELMKPEVEPGDLIILLRHAPIDVVLVRGKKFSVVAEGDILGKIDQWQLNKILYYMPEESEGSKESYSLSDGTQARVTSRDSGLVMVETDKA